MEDLKLEILNFFELRCMVNKETYDSVVKKSEEEEIFVADLVRKAIKLYLKATENFDFNNIVLKGVNNCESC